MKTTEYSIEVVQFGKIKSILSEGVIYVAVEEDKIEGAAFICPCGCGDNLYLTNDPRHIEGGSLEPRKIFWHTKDKTISITPSIQVLGACRSHFHITENKVI